VASAEKTPEKLDGNYQKLIGCFKQVFPNMNTGDIPFASQEQVASWDSIAHVTLLSLVGEEFGVDIDFDEFAEAGSFTAILNLIRANTF
jgi:acyl carrier protein